MNDVPHGAEPARALLEVIVETPADAVEAEAGGADRLEIIRTFEVGGLTPDFDEVRRILRASSLPAWVMIRERPDYALGDEAAALARLREQAARFAALGVEGLVTGYVRDGRVDIEALRAADAGVPLTFHRAFEAAVDPFAALETLREFPAVDRVLTNAGAADWAARAVRLTELRRHARPRIEILVGGGLDAAGRVRRERVAAAARAARDL